MLRKGVGEQQKRDKIDCKKQAERGSFFRLVFACKLLLSPETMKYIKL
jgi:hypothetical protein